MGQVLKADKFNLTKISSSVISLDSGSTVTIGGQQYTLSSSVNLTLSGLAANTLYMVYAVLSGGVVNLIISTNMNSVGPSGYLSWKLIGAFHSISTNTFSSIINIQGPPVIDWHNKGAINIGATTTAPTKGITTQSDRVMMRGIGDSADFIYEYSQSIAGTAGSGTYLFSLPAGMSFDSTKVTYIGTIGGVRQAAATAIGTGVTSTDPANGVNGSVVLFAYDATRFYAAIVSSQTTTGAGDSSVDESVSSVSFSLNSASQGLRFMVRAAIQGWSNTQLIDL